MSILKSFINHFIPPQKNSLGGHDMARDFFRYGTGNVTSPSWSQVLMGDRDKYSGYMYAGITRRANKVVWLAENCVKTKASDAIATAAKKNEETIVHPYLEIIDESPTFSNDQFWREIQTFIDLRGQYFIYVRRGKAGSKLGDIQEMKLLRPYEITVLRSDNDLDVIGYVETRGGVWREFEPHEIIPIAPLNPIDRNTPFSMADAATDSQFTLKEATEQMRTTARRNRKYPGVVLFGGGEVALDQEQVSNFKSRMRGKSAEDEPMFAAGSAGNISWNDMQIDMRKSSLDMVNEIQLNALSAVMGTSKTKLGIEQSGVTRDTADVQDDLFVSDHAIPALQLILSALNQDYKTSYPDEYKKTGYRMYIDSPLDDDKETELKGINVRKESFSLYTELRNKGYDADTAAKFASGEKDLTDIGEPTEEPVVEKPPLEEDDPTKKDDDPKPPVKPADNAHDHTHDTPPAVRNQLGQDEQAAIAQQEGSLKNTIVNAQGQLVAAVMARVPQLTYETQEDIIEPEQQQAAVATLTAALVAYYSTVLPIQALTVIARRVIEFGLPGNFSMDELVTQYIEATAANAAQSHIATILDDIRQTVRETVERLVQEEVKRTTPTGDQTAEDVLELARRKAMEGVGQAQIISAIRQEFNTSISKTRAQTIARTESRRAYNRAQFEADRQFLTQNDLMASAYKKWITRGPDPCPFCKMLAAKPAVPFMQPFAKLGDTLTASFTKSDGTMSVRTMRVGFEDAMSGEVHPNGFCTYQLIIE